MTTNIETEERSPDDFGAAYRRLRVLIGDRMATHWLPPSGEVILGRDGDCSIVIDEPSVSRRHARLHLGDEIRLEDLGSANGSHVDSRRLVAREPTLIAPGGSFRLGGVLAILESAGADAVRSRGLSERGSAARHPHETIELIAAAPISVLILGETGVGKEVMAERIHRLSPRRHKALLRLNCAALSETLLESELFGHERGAFTGASETKPGLLETAHGGTVFLDEIGELPLGIQAKLLRVVEERTLLRVGAVTSRAVDVRFIAATNRDLEAEIGRGAFRRDLYYRLNGFSFLVPPLRDRVDEIEGLAAEFIAHASARFGAGQRLELTADALEAMRRYSWPGNIRELRNVIERAVALSGTGPITLEHLPIANIRRPMSAGAGGAADDTRLQELPLAEAVDRQVESLETHRIIAALREAAGNQTTAARLLGISRRTLINRLEQYGIPRPRKGRRA